MKTVLVILTQSNLIRFKNSESVSMAMLLATFGHQVQVLLKDDALSLLQPQLKFVASVQPFKPVSNLVDSFEFYDICPILVQQQDQQQHWLKNTTHDIRYICLNAEFLNQFDHVLYA